MIWKVVHKNVSMLQMTGYCLAAIVGLTIVMCALMFYAQASEAFKRDSESAVAEYISVSRPVSALSAFGFGKSADGFSQEDLAEIAEQPWAAAVAPFSSSDFGVSAGVDLGGRAMHTQLFFEAVPNEFLDTIPAEWAFDASDPAAIVPIILPRDYLALYNFGYAATRGLPQLSEILISRIPIALYFSGNGLNERRTGRVVAFTDRLNTIAVPLEFLQWANARYGNAAAEKPLPSRALIKTSNPGDPAIDKYLSEHNLAASGTSDATRHAAFALRIATSIAAGVGIAICALALFILLLSVGLLMEKNKEKNQTLLFLGYSPAQVAGVYAKMIIIANAGVLAFAILISFLLAPLWQAPLEEIGLHATGKMMATAVAAAIMCVATLVAIFQIKRNLR